MKEVAQEMRVNPPTENDIDFMLKELDENSDGQVSKEEFLQLIVLVLGKMLESEYIMMILSLPFKKLRLKFNQLKKQDR